MELSFTTTTLLDVDVVLLANEYLEEVPDYPDGSEDYPISQFVDEYMDSLDDVYSDADNRYDLESVLTEAVLTEVELIKKEEMEKEAQTEKESQTEKKTQTENRKVYIISYSSYEWEPMDITDVTDDPFKAKAIIKDIVLDHVHMDSDYPTWFGKTKEERLAYLEQFAQDLIDGNTKNHESNEFDSVRVWCDVREVH